MPVSITQGNPAMGATSACILPTNQNLHIRGELAKTFSAVGGPLVQNSALTYAPVPHGTVIPISTGATPYRRLYAAAAFPFEQDSIDWSLVIRTLCDAIRKAVSEGHTTVSIPFFLDAPDGDRSAVESNAVAAMRAGVDLALSTVAADVNIVALNDRQRTLLDAGFSAAGPKGKAEPQQVSTSASDDSSDKDESPKPADAVTDSKTTSNRPRRQTASRSRTSTK